MLYLVKFERGDIASRNVFHILDTGDLVCESVTYENLLKMYIQNKNLVIEGLSYNLVSNSIIVDTEYSDFTYNSHIEKLGTKCIGVVNTVQGKAVVFQLGQNRIRWQGSTTAYYSIVRPELNKV